MATERLECPYQAGKFGGKCERYVVLELPDGAMKHAVRAQVDVRCPEHGYRMTRSERV